MSAGGNIVVTQRRKQQILMICDNVYYADLIVIPMKDIAIIPGMDWLSYHGAQIDCGDNTVALRGPNGNQIVYQGDRNARLEAELQLNALKEVKIKDIQVIREFKDVFPKKVPGMLPDREIEFTIDLIPGTSPIAQAPYKMGPKELVELKKRLDELEEKDSLEKVYLLGELL